MERGGEDERIVRTTSHTAMKVSGLHEHRDGQSVGHVMDTSFLNVVFLPQLMQKLLARSLRDQLYAATTIKDVA